MFVISLYPIVAVTFFGAPVFVGGVPQAEPQDAPFVRSELDGPVALNEANPPRHVRFGLDFDGVFAMGARWVRVGFDGGVDDVIRLDHLPTSPERVWRETLGVVATNRQIHLSLDDGAAAPSEPEPVAARWVRSTLDD